MFLLVHLVIIKCILSYAAHLFKLSVLKQLKKALTQNIMYILFCYQRRQHGPTTSSALFSLSLSLSNSIRALLLLYAAQIDPGKLPFI